jgi:bacterial/archaeal transporter family-2 protein
MQYLFLLLALLTGAAVSVQTAVNSNLRLALNSPILAALISFGTGFVTLLVVFLSVGGNVPGGAVVRALPWWKYTGGLIGAVYVTSVIVTVQRVGPANLTSLNVAGQLIAAVILDHYGLLGFAQHTANGWRLLGVGLMLAGAWLIVRN